MKLLLRHSGENYLIDLDGLKPKTFRDIVLESGDDELMVADSDQLDMTDINQLLGDALKPKAEPSKVPVTKAAQTGDKPKPKHDLEAIRTWLNANGHDVAKTGRIAEEKLKLYYAANPGLQPK